MPFELYTTTGFILNGDSERIKKGYELAKDSNSGFVIISPADDSMIKDYEKQYGPLKAKYILENKARTTFENVYSDFTSNLFSVIPAYRFPVKPKIGKALACPYSL